MANRLAVLCITCAKFGIVEVKSGVRYGAWSHCELRPSNMLQLRAVGATSTDDSHPAEHSLDGDPATYWLTTGLFPQELVLSLPSPTRISAVHVKCCNVGQLSIQNSTQDRPEQFTELVKSDFKSQVGQLQSEQFKLETAVLTRHLKLVITRAYDHFVSVHTISVTAEK